MRRILAVLPKDEEEAPFTVSRRTDFNKRGREVYTVLLLQLFIDHVGAIRQAGLRLMMDEAGHLDH